MARNKLATKYLEQSEFERWNQFVVSAPTGSIYSTTPYLEALCEATGGTFQILAAHKGDELLGGVALYEEKKLYGLQVANRLLLYYNGIVLKDSRLKYPSDQTSRSVAVMDAIHNRLNESNYGRLLLHNRSGISDVRSSLNHGWSAWPSYTYVVDISDLEMAWSKVDQNLRRLITRCRDNDVVVSQDNDFDSFFRMHFDTHLRKGAPFYLPKETFRRFYETLRSQDLCQLYFARLKDGRPVAAQLVLLGDHPVTHTVCAAADGEFLKLGTTPFLRWSAFEALSNLGYEANDLTDAALNSVTRFKSQLGGNLVVNMVLKRPDKLSFALGEKGVALTKKVLRPIYKIYKGATKGGT